MKSNRFFTESKIALGVAGLAILLDGGVAHAAKRVPHPAESISSQSEVHVVLPKAIEKMVANGRGVQVVDSFKVEGTDLTAWIVIAGKERRIFYVPPTGNVAILGLVFDENLKNLTTAHVMKYSGTKVVPKKPGASPYAGLGFESDPTSQMTLAQLATADASHVEGVGRDVYVIYDPACVHCHKVWKDTRGLLDKIRIHWIPIAKVSSQSAQLADVILGAVDAPAAFAAAAERKLALSPSVSPRTQSILRKNALILDASGKRNVPYIAFAAEGKVYSYLGSPSPSVLAAIVGENSAEAAKVSSRD